MFQVVRQRRCMSFLGYVTVPIHRRNELTADNDDSEPTRGLVLFFPERVHFPDKPRAGAEQLCLDADGLGFITRCLGPPPTHQLLSVVLSAPACDSPYDLQVERG